MSCLAIARRWFGVGLFLVIASSTFGASSVAGPRPNIVLLVTDDQRADCLSCAGHRQLQTPHIDRLAREGVRHTNAFVTTAICCTSRASLICGQYARRHKVWDFRTALTPDALAASFPAQLRQAGYRGACLGKWGIGGDEPRALFDVWHAWGGQGEFFEELDGEQVHNSEMLARRAEQFLRDGPADQPFFLIVYYKSPHEPYQPDPVDAPLYAGITFPDPAATCDFDRLPPFIQKSEGRIRLVRDCPTPAAYQEFVRQYLRCVAGVDRSVGRILAVLDEQQRTEDTLVIFSSDNGFLLGEHGLSGKWLAYEESIRVPLVVRYPQNMPGRPLAGTVCDDLALNIDIAPTILKAAGLAIPPAVDGVPLVRPDPALPGSPPPGAGPRDDFFYEHHYQHGGRIPRTDAVRTRRLKYVVFPGVEPPQEALYNLVGDPGEAQNLVDEASWRPQLDQLRGRYREYLAKLGPPPP